MFSVTFPMFGKTSVPMIEPLALPGKPILDSFLSDRKETLSVKFLQKTSFAQV